MSKKQNNNLDWLVAARGYVMYCVFLGHLIVSYINDQKMTSLVIMLQHLEPTVSPFFAILTGAFYSRGANSFKEYAKLKFGQRMIPVYFYLLLIIPFYLAFPYPNITSLKLSALYIVGIPVVSWSSWFLIALFTSEMLYFFIIPYGNTKAKMLAIALLCYILARLYSHFLYTLPGVAAMLGSMWMLHTVLIFCAFFMVGALAKPMILEMSNWSKAKVMLVGMVSFLLLRIGVLTNEFILPVEGNALRPFVNDQMIAVSSAMYGKFLPFILCTLFAPLTLLCLARLIPVTRFMRSCGDYSLILLGLNGIFLKVLNWHITSLYKPTENLLIYTLPYALIISAISMALCLPVAILLAKYFPQLTGKPMLKGPLLPALYKKVKKTAKLS